MLQFEKKTEAFIKSRELIEKGDYLVAAVSGGPDSLALIDYFINRKEKYGIQLAVAHVDHMLRGEESVQDLLFVKGYCEKRSIPFHSVAIDIKRKMEMDKTGMQETARKYRYQFLLRVMEEINANKLMVAHHGDDQMETILMRLTRGATGQARAGMKVRRSFGKGELIRPLLAVSRQEVEEYCHYYKLEPRIDPSNEKRDYARNRFRLDVLPILKQENGQALEHFQRFHDDLTEDEVYLQSEAKARFNKICQVDENQEIHLDIPSFLVEPLPLQRRVIHLILNYLYQYNTPDILAVHTDLIQRLLRSENPSGRLDFPKGMKVIRSYASCCFTFKERSELQSPYYYELYEGNKAVLPNGGTLELGIAQEMLIKEDLNSFLIDGREIEFPLIIRTRKPGDRISLKGMKGSKKIKDIFIDQKVSLEERKIWPIVVDNTGKILWIPGLKKSSFEGKSQNSHNYVLLYDQTQTISGGRMN
ncbi:tRNA lysidine(34) synthetase TilS [Lederbergia galactosidilytica]|uniref:tRNA(Ile)-lysidine synthase n=2 Tax=Lederbergia galactosidilytica TaxID=217031 RepID=A0A177ZVZ7_9BACI|nr:tRNA lysidine(34) synthetase TilS [Lederbergia galactosidilytica]KRG12875.1 tRNA(Ile)-lysidine synthetase [Virgibacillus soli]MBP1916840.1 tRNA(Ile)-lysidine synthase [Lederbergia galactosidilytica]OAK72086.1 tRNA(Ile)-lysidine synthetase [Lederbergia galactosidilytica]